MEYLFNTKVGREKLFKFLKKPKIASKKNDYCKVAKTLSFVSQIDTSYFLISCLKETNGQLDGDIEKKNRKLTDLLPINKLTVDRQILP